jgi:hypothetical protein
MTENSNNMRSLFAKTLFIVGIIIVILILAYAVIQIVPRLFSSFATVNDAVRTPFANNSLEVEVEDRTVNSGEAVILAWDYEPTNSGVYEIEYGCANYLEAELGTSEGNREIACDTIYHIAPTTQSIALIPTLSRDNVLVDMPVTVRYVRNTGEVVKTDTVDLTIRNRNADDLAGSGTIIDTNVINPGPADSSQNNNQTNTQQNTTQNQTQPTNNTVNVPTIADLTVTNMFAIDDATVGFTISNIGSRSTGSWYFNYRMPDGDLEISPLQPSLNPGGAIRYTLRLEDVPDGIVVVSADPYNAISELSNSNNVASAYVNGDNGSGQVDYDDDDEADLRIDDLEVGRMSGSRFVEDDEIDEDDDAAVRFVVENIGGESTGSWRFEIDNVPYDDDDRYRSARQSSLRPGESVEIIVEFENPDEGNYNIEVTVDSEDDVDEERESNNDESERLEVRD